MSAPNSVDAVNAVLYRAKHDVRFAARVTDPGVDLCAEHGCTAEQQRAVREPDFSWLARAGVIPNLILVVARLHGISPDELARKLAEAEEADAALPHAGTGGSR
ncbi:hypothetical protein [Streptosporangium sp. NPDC051022]|uniref:hypothetical protein n=1 Tax=Streptosporangium sp. NPDC051022 TaxID=3155752 RepID=UPI003416CE4D